jgi:hypothetical protein
MTKTVKQYEGNWIVWNTKTDQMAEINAFDDYFMGKVKRRYRVDKGGRTQASLIDTFAEAKKIAGKLVR